MENKAQVFWNIGKKVLAIISKVGTIDELDEPFRKKGVKLFIDLPQEPYEDLMLSDLQAKVKELTEEIAEQEFQTHLSLVTVSAPLSKWESDTLILHLLMEV